MFVFYMAPVLPFFVLGVTLVLQDVLGRPGAPPWRRSAGLAAVSGYVAVVAGTFAFFYPVLSGEVIPRPAWGDRMWLQSWI